MKLGLGQLQLAPEVFWSMTPREFSMCAEGWFEHEIYLQEEDWKRTIAQINIHLPKGKKINMNKISKKVKPRLMSKEELIDKISKWQ